MVYSYFCVSTFCIETREVENVLLFKRTEALFRVFKQVYSIEKDLLP